VFVGRECSFGSGKAHSAAATQIALIGIVMLIALALVRDTSLHQIDRLISRRIFGPKVNWILDLGGLGLVLLTSEWRLRLKQKDRPKARIRISPRSRSRERV
jgi:hypothetical protein